MKDKHREPRLRYNGEIDRRSITSAGNLRNVPHYGLKPCTVGVYRIVNSAGRKLPRPYLLRSFRTTADAWAYIEAYECPDTLAVYPLLRYPSGMAKPYPDKNMPMMTREDL